jgi:hypothetical protein
VTEAAIVNLTRTHGATYDEAPVMVPASYPVKEVTTWIEGALAGCTVICKAPAPGVDVEEMFVHQVSGVHYVRYVPFYFVTDLSKRDEARGEVLERVAAVLAEKGVISKPNVEE